MTTFQVWYMKPGWFRDGICGGKPDAANLGATHVHLKDVDAANLDAVFFEMQAEHWSPNGEACDLIDAKGLGHTSMSVGDVIVTKGAGTVYIVASFGFEQLP